MTCPVCSGSGWIRKRFLIFFKRDARCPKCLGTGTYPPPMRPNVRVTRSSGTRDWDDDRWPASPTFGSSSTSAAAERDAFEVGSGGRSGGGGATASWDGPSETPPVIAEPFGGGDHGSAATSAMSADAADSGSSSDTSSSSGGDEGTSY